MEKEDIDLWSENIYDALKDMSDLEFQKLSWMGKLPDIISSFTEVVCILIDDFAFADYIAYLSIKPNADKNIILKMNELKEMISEYAKINMDEAKILRDPNWKIITYKAAEIVKDWNNN